MKKDLFRKVVCLVIALMMMMPAMPSSLVSAEDFTSEIDLQDDVNYVPINLKTTGSGIEGVIAPMSTYNPGPGTYDVANSTLVLNVVGSSQNNHTQATNAWYDEFGNFYLAVQSTHELGGTMTINVTDTQAITSDDTHIYENGVYIKIEGVSYAPNTVVNGNVGDARWTVYKFNTRTFEAGTYTFNITGTGGGHDINSRTLTISIPRIDISATKVWNGGSDPRPNIQLQLYRNGNAFGSPIDIVHPVTSYTWYNLDESNSRGVLYTFTVDEISNLDDYDKSKTGNKKDGFVITNTYNPKITIIADDGTWTYDGQSHSKGTFTTTGVPNVYTVEAVVTGSITDFGTEDNVVDSYVIKLGEVDVTDQFSNVTTKNGTLTVNKRPVTLTSESASKPYDNTPLTRTTVTITGDGFVEGEATAEATGTITNVGFVANTIVITAGTNYKETNYSITKNEGTLTITAKAITITADAKTKAYGEEDPNLTYQITTGSLEEGDSLTGALTREPGEAVGTYEIQQGTLGNNNYTITYVPADLTITAKDDDDDDDDEDIPDTDPPLADLEKFDHFAYVIGYPEGDVRPLNNITREEVAMIFYRLLTDESRNNLLSDSNPFTDLENHGWSNRAISTLFNAGIIKGYPDGTFKPSDPISRAEFATIAAKFDKLELGSTSEFTDIFGHWAEKYITSSEIKGWIKGYPDLTFKPEQDITRAEAMTLINNVLERLVPEENIHPDAMFWPDNTSDKWYYEAVMEATNSHNYIYEEDKDELWTGMKANKVWP